MVEHRVSAADSPWRQAECAAAAAAQLPVDIVHDCGFGWSADVFQPHTGSRVLNLERDLASLPPLRRLRSVVSPGFRRWRRALAATERRQMAAAAAIVAVSESVGRAIGRRYPAAEGRIRVVPNGVDTRRFSPDARRADREAARRALGLGEASAFLFVAQNFRLKGLDALLDSTARLLRETGAMVLLVAGDGDEATYRRKAEGLRLGDRVRFLGRVTAMPALYAAGDVLVQPTFHDACSLTTLEALACGLPVVTTRANGAADGMVSGCEGYVLERAGDVDALTGAMRRLLDADHRCALGAAAARLGQQRSFEANCDGILAVYHEVLQRRAMANTRGDRSPAAWPSAARDNSRR
ncbi:MAG: glycosyltransferase family 4 protein [Alphaproteobacteria bacterium]|nr:glycosyltransferase family 4 protein [Alphaproteobacteria bacterium]